MINETNTLGLATKIVDDIIADPAKAGEFKTILAATLADLYNSGEAAPKKYFTLLRGSKGFLQSKTFWGIVISAGATVAGWFGHHIGNDQIVAYTTSAVGLAGSALAFYGRYMAKEQLTWNGTTTNNPT